MRKETRAALLLGLVASGAVETNRRDLKPYRGDITAIIRVRKCRCCGTTYEGNHLYCSALCSNKHQAGGKRTKRGFRR